MIGKCWNGDPAQGSAVLADPRKNILTILKERRGKALDPSSELMKTVHVGAEGGLCPAMDVHRLKRTNN